MFSFNCNELTGCNLSLAGFNLNIQTHKNLHSMSDEHAISISPNIGFSSKMIAANKLHFIINLDGSGSMGSNIDSYINGTSRMNLSKQCIKELVLFLYTLVTEGKEVFMSLVVFNNHVKVLLNHRKLTCQEDCIKLMCEIDKICATGTTNMGAAIVETMAICANNPNDTTFKILISDGYITAGQIRIDEIKHNYEGFYNATIGIGNENDYDKILLKTLTSELDERSCFNSDEMKDQIIDSVFSNVTKIADKITIESGCIMSCISNNENVKQDGIIQKNVKFTTRVFVTTKTNMCNITINNVPIEYIKSGDYNISDGLTEERFSNQFIGSINATLMPCPGGEFVDITFHLNLKISDNYKSSVMDKSFRKIQNFIEVTESIMNIDLGNLSSFASDYKKNKSIHDKISNLIKYTHRLESNDQNNYMLGVLDKFKTSILPYISNNSNRSALDSSLSTPLRMCRSQTSSGNYAFFGRQVSMRYSMSAADLTIPDSQLNYNSSEDECGPAPTLQIQSNVSELYPVVTNELYPGAINALYPGAINALHPGAINEL